MPGAEELCHALAGLREPMEVTLARDSGSDEAVPCSGRFVGPMEVTLALGADGAMAVPHRFR